MFIVVLIVFGVGFVVCIHIVYLFVYIFHDHIVLGLGFSCICSVDGSIIIIVFGMDFIIMGVGASVCDHQ